MKQLAIAFTGPSNSGKTTIIEKISKELSSKYKIAIIKHDPKNKATFDKEGKDSDRFYKSGADVAVISDVKTAIFKHQTSTLDDLIEHFNEFDLLIVEGLKTWKLPRIGIFRGNIEKDYLPYLQAVAVDHTIPKEQLEDINVKILNLNDTQEIIEYIWQNAKKVK